MATGKMNINVNLEINSAQLVLNVGRVTLGAKNRNKMKDRKLCKKQNEDILQAVIALLNSGGGMIEVEIENENYSYQRDGIGQDLEKSFANILPSIHNYLAFMQKDKYFNIFVNSWSSETSGLQIVTLKTNLYRRDVTCTNMMRVTDTLEILKAKSKTGRRLSGPKLPPQADVQKESDIKDLADAFFNRTQLRYKEKVPFTESTHVEMKAFSTGKWLQRVKEILPHYVSAFANTDGGYLFIVLNEEKEVIGFKTRVEDFNRIETEIKKHIRELPIYHFCRQKKHIKSTCKFIPVYDERNACRYVCALKIRPFCCVVFAKEPESWHVKDNKVKQFTVEEWTSTMLPANP
ncbi:SLN12 protein, partial [Crocuta crocuta]